MLTRVKVSFEGVTALLRWATVTCIPTTLKIAKCFTCLHVKYAFLGLRLLLYFIISEWSDAENCTLSKSI